MQIILLACIGSMAATLAIVAAAAWWKRSGAERRRVRSAMERFAEAAEKTHASLESIPILIEGLTRVAQEQVGQLNGMTTAVGDLKTMLFSGGDSSRGYMEYSEAAANDEFRIQELMRRGNIGRKEAEDRIREEKVYSNIRITG